jgi:hypothetical protein
MVDWTKALEGRLAMIVRLRGTGTAIQVGHSEASKCMNQPEPRPYLERRVAKTEHIKFYINVCPLFTYCDEVYGTNLAYKQRKQVKSR